MDYVEELSSGRTPLVKKAAKKILKNRLKGYGPFLHQALEDEMEKPKSWESQMYLLYAIAATDCTEEMLLCLIPIFPICCLPVLRKQYF